MVHVAGALLLFSLLDAGAPVRLFDPPKVDASPTAYACSAETLQKGQRCVFEAAPSRASAEQNRGRIQAMGAPVCQAAAEVNGASEPAVNERCKVRFNQALTPCAVEGALVDEAGRFAPAAKACYRALSEVRAQTETLAHAAPACCSCLAEKGCAGAGASCVAQASRGALGSSCAADACDAACTELFAATPTPKRAAARSH